MKTLRRKPTRWSRYVETPWGYFRMAIRPPEQPDGVIVFWHDAEGAHASHAVIDDGPVLGRFHRLVSRLRGERP